LLHTPQQSHAMFLSGPDNPQNYPTRTGGSRPMVPLAHMNQPTNGISIGLAVCAQLITDTRTTLRVTYMYVAIGRISAMHAMWTINCYDSYSVHRRLFDGFVSSQFVAARH